MISYKLHSCRNIASVYIPAVKPLLLRSFVLFTIGLHSTPEKLKTISKPTFNSKTPG